MKYMTSVRIPINSSSLSDAYMSININGSDNVLTHVRFQSGIWTDTVLYWVIFKWTIRNKLQWNLNPYHETVHRQRNLKMSFAKWQLYCLGLSVLIVIQYAWLTNDIKFPLWIMVICNTSSFLESIWTHKLKWRFTLPFWKWLKYNVVCL